MENGEATEPVMLKPTLKPDYHFGGVWNTKTKKLKVFIQVLGPMERGL